MNDTVSARPAGTASPLALVGRHPRRLVPVIYAACALAFVTDLMRANVLAYGIFYVPLVATAVFDKSRHGLHLLTAIACLMVIVGALFPFVPFDLPDLIGNRILSILAILATAVFVEHARATQARLAEQTARAEAAERAKSEVFQSLSEQMRAPLHGLLGLLRLMATTCRPDQREALARVKDGGEQLLHTIDNLIDLTQADGRDHRPGRPYGDGDERAAAD